MSLITIPTPECWFALREAVEEKYAKACERIKKARDLNCGINEPGICLPSGEADAFSEILTAMDEIEAEHARVR